MNDNNKNKKLFFFDLDGTLLNNKGTISEYTRNVLVYLQEQGHKVAISTGRNWEATKKQYEAINLTTVVSNLEGARIHCPADGTFLERRQGINHELVNEVLKDKKVTEYLLNVGAIYPNSIMEALDPYAEKQTAGFLVGPTWYTRKIDPEKGLKTSPFVCYLLFENNLDKKEEMVNYFRDKYSASFIVTLFPFFGTENKENRWVIELSPKGVNKSYALHNISSYYNITNENTIAFGNDVNDVSMLKAAGLGVVVKNAPDNIKAHADQVTEFTNDEDGCAKWLVKYFDIQDYKF